MACVFFQNYSFSADQCAYNVVASRLTHFSPSLERKMGESDQVSG